MSVDTGESVYDLIPKPQPRVVKPPMHRSKFPGDIPPTASTFGRSVGAQIMETNSGGDYADQQRSHRYRQEHSSFGPKALHTADPTTFLQKHSQPELPKPKRFVYTDRRKAPTTKRDEVPPVTQTREINFIRENARTIINSPAKKVGEQPASYLQKPEYGQAPAYLYEVKRDIEEEKEIIRQARERELEEVRRNQPSMRLMPEEERVELLESLKKKWEQVNKQYQNCTHMVTLDTNGKIRRKEQYELELQDLERSIERLSKKYVFVQE